MCTTDSFGDGQHIDANNDRQCSPSSPCYLYHSQPEKAVFTFTATKDSSTINVKIHSTPLRRKIRRVLGSVSTIRFEKDRHGFDGLVLLRYYEVLRDHLRNLYAGQIHSRRFLAEMSLLVDDFLNDSEIYQSFGHEALFRRGYLTFEHWQTFQSAKVNSDLDSLEGSFDLLGEHQRDFSSCIDQCLSDSPPKCLPPSTTRREKRTFWDLKDAHVRQLLQKFGSLLARENDFGLPESSSLRGHLLFLWSKCGLHEARCILERDLLYACDKGDLYEARRILEHDAPLFANLHSSSFDIDIVDYQTTPLIAAIRSGDQRIVKLLIRHGANVNILLSIGTPLSVAAKIGSEAMIRILLRQGADLHTAALALKGSLPTLEAQRGVNRLNRIASRYREEVSHNNSKRRQLLHLRKLFTEEHAAIVRATDSRRNRAAEDPDMYWSASRLGRLWSSSINRETHEAWRAGMKMMRGLCNGVLPWSLHEGHAKFEPRQGNFNRYQRLNQTIMFLAIAKAMSKVMESQGDYDLQRDFDTDLSRWQILFDAENGELDTFRSAIRDIWFINLEDYPRQIAPDAESMEFFQHMALNLISRAREAFHFADLDQGGLLSIQSRWRQKIEERSLSDNDSSIATDARELTFNQNHPDNTSLDHSAERGEEASEGRALRKSMGSNATLVQHQHVILLLMAGAVFSFVIAFLLGMFETAVPGCVILTWYLTDSKSRS